MHARVCEETKPTTSTLDSLLFKENSSNSVFGTQPLDAVDAAALAWPTWLSWKLAIVAGVVVVQDCLFFLDILLSERDRGQNKGKGPFKNRADLPVSVMLSDYYDHASSNKYHSALIRVTRGPRGEPEVTLPQGQAEQRGSNEPPCYVFAFLSSIFMQRF